MLKLTKRDCSIVDFYKVKIKVAINKSFLEVYGIINEDVSVDISDYFEYFAKKVSETPYKTYGPEAMNRQEVREVFNFIREKNYPLFRDLYECNLKSLEEENNAWN